MADRAVAQDECLLPSSGRPAHDLLPKRDRLPSTVELAERRGLARWALAFLVAELPVRRNQMSNGLTSRPTRPTTAGRDIPSMRENSGRPRECILATGRGNQAPVFPGPIGGHDLNLAWCHEPENTARPSEVDARDSRVVSCHGERYWWDDQGRRHQWVTSWHGCWSRRDLCVRTHDPPWPAHLRRTALYGSSVQSLHGARGKRKARQAQTGPLLEPKTSPVLSR